MNDTQNKHGTKQDTQDLQAEAMQQRNPHLLQTTRILSVSLFPEFVNKRLKHLCFLSIWLIAMIWLNMSIAAAQDTCSTCHTMHNSQDGTFMSILKQTTPDEEIQTTAMTVETTRDPSEPVESLLRGTCLDCHAMNTGSATYKLGDNNIPQVLHNGSKDLAGGNFRYIKSKGDNRGHNIDELTGIDSILFSPPGVYSSGHSTYINTNRLSCASSAQNNTVGCHGYRRNSAANPDGLMGAHHMNASGRLDQATEPANSYRFLMGVKGYESPDWEENATRENHNEYYGLKKPIKISGCSGTQGCHSDTDGVRPPDGTMSQFCATCHSNFHTLGSNGVGQDTASPFIRHPTDLALPATGEFASFTIYNLDVPVARTTGVPSSPGSTVTPGSDAVMCLSCHRAHASAYPDMLRWDYSTMVVGGGGTTGCLACHTSKS